LTNLLQHRLHVRGAIYVCVAALPATKNALTGCMRPVGCSLPTLALGGRGWFKNKFMLYVLCT